MFKSLKFMGGSLFAYDVAHPWLVFYISNGLYLLDQKKFSMTEDLTERCVEFL